MLAAERRDLYLARLKRDGKLVARDLAVELGLSEDSIRKDLRELAAAGLAQRVYGGALPVSPALGDLSARSTIAVEGKQSVAALAATLIKPGMTVILDGGTTTRAVVDHLPLDLEVTIVTHSPTIAAALIDHPGIEIFLIGGRVFKHSAVTSGAAAAEAAMTASADLFLLGVTGVHPEAGLTTGDSDEAAMKRLLSRRAAETWVLASSEKVGAASPYTVVPFSEVAGVITDAAASDTVAALTALGVTVRSA
jgi:DeoR/GlpR family transcriptional regulator of sugar metabolism